MKVLILGATGFIGFAAAEAFVRAGHIVYGVTRSKQSGTEQLAANEIVPIVADPHTEEGRKLWGKVAADVDVVIDALAGSGSADALATFNNFLDYIDDRPKGSPKPTYIYSSGLWINAKGYGGLDKWTDERQPTTSFNAAVQWRTAIEGPVLASDRVNGVVIRPGVLYGKSSSFFGFYVFDPALKAAKESKDKIFETPYEEDSRVATIHTDDLADLYLRVADRGPLLAGQVFLASNSATERLKDILDAVVRVSGAKGYKAKKPSDDWEKAWVSTVLAKPSLGYALTGWTPRKLSLVDGIDVYWAAYLASNGEQ